jgi:hypothetical protein
MRPPGHRRPRCRGTVATLSQRHRPALCRVVSELCREACRERLQHTKRNRHHER